MALEYKAELERGASRDGAHGLKRVCLLQNEASEETQQCETPLQWAVTTPRTYFMLDPSQKRAATVAARARAAAARSAAGATSSAAAPLPTPTPPR